MKPCDGCALCCKVLAVPEIDKPACVWCKKLERIGEHTARCGIHPERPDACRTFQCLWTLDLKMQPELRPDRCGVVFAMDEYLDGPFVADEPWLHAHVDPNRPNAWLTGLPWVVISTFLGRGGSVAVHVASWWRTFHRGEIRSGYGEVDYGFAVDMFRRATLPDGMPTPTLDFDELMRRGSI
jgi:hypothetical protein